MSTLAILLTIPVPRPTRRPTRSRMLDRWFSMVSEEGDEFVADGRVAEILNSALGSDDDVSFLGEDLLMLPEDFSEPPLHTIALDSIANFARHGDAKASVSGG